MLKSKFKVGSYTCELAVSIGATKATWSPRIPTKLSKKELRQYRAGHDALLANYAEETGANVMLVET